MRLDKFLQLSRLIKQRAWAKEACDKGLVYVNDLPAKPGREVSAGQKVRIRYARKIVEVEIIDLPTGNVSKKQAPDLYRLIHEERFDAELE